MKMKLLVGVLVFLIVVNLATIGTFLYVRFFEHRPSGMPGDTGFGGRAGGPPPLRMLDEPQRRKMRDLMESLRTETSGLNDRAAALERHTFDLLQQDPAPTDSIDQVLKEISSIRLEISRKVSRKILEAKSFLPSQLQRMIIEEMSRGHHGPSSGGPMPPPGDGGDQRFPPPGPPPHQE